MKRRGVVIQGSSRSAGNTSLAVSRLCQRIALDVVDLKTKQIGYFDYAHQNASDDFIPLMKDIVERYDLIVFATPIYWYSMSAEMKTFFDRISDCLKTEKETGRKLRGMDMAVLSCGSGDYIPESFFEPFKLSANYLGMQYLGDVHTWITDSAISDEVDRLIEKFSTSLTQKAVTSPN